MGKEEKQADGQQYCKLYVHLLFEVLPYKQMSLNAKVAYTFFLDRLQLSKQNGWVDHNGSYIFFSRASLQELLNVSNRTAIKAIEELKKYNLVTEKRQGRGRPNKIYVQDISNPQVFQFLKCKKYTSRDVKITPLEVKKLHISSAKSSLLEVKKLHPNQTNTNQTNNSQTNNSQTESNQLPPGPPEDTPKDVPKGVQEAKKLLRRWQGE